MTTSDFDQDLLDSAARRLVRMQARPPSADDLAEFRAWLAADIRHVAAMDLVEQAWRDSGPRSMDPLPRPAPRYDRQRTKPDVRLSSRIQAHGRRRLAAIVAAAAAAVASLVIGETFHFIPRTYVSSETTRSVRFHDGGVMRMAPHSETVVHWTPWSREIDQRRGSAEYAVASENRRPFTVRAGWLDVRATGTRFTVRRSADDTRVVLMEGGLDLMDPGDHAVLGKLHAGQSARRRADGARLEITQPAGPNVMLEFDAMRLSDALDLFTAGTTTTVTIADADAELRDLEISGRYRRSDLVPFLNGLTRIEDLRWRRTQADEIVIEAD